MGESNHGVMNVGAIIHICTYRKKSSNCYFAMGSLCCSTFSHHSVTSNNMAMDRFIPLTLKQLPCYIKLFYIQDITFILIEVVLLF